MKNGSGDHRHHNHYYYSDDVRSYHPHNDCFCYNLLCCVSVITFSVVVRFSTIAARLVFTILSEFSFCHNKIKSKKINTLTLSG